VPGRQTPGVVIDFEDLDAPGNGTPGLNVGNQYADRGITFNFPDALDYSKGLFAIPGFAHSGTKAVELCYSQEFCTVPLGMDFTTGQSRVKVWVGYDAVLGSTLDSPQTVILRAFDASGAQIGQDTATLGPATDRNSIPIATPLEVTQSAGNIVSATVGFLGAETRQIFNNALAVDDVEFDSAGPPPVCLATQPPTLSVNSPADGQIFLVNSFTVDANATSVDPFATIQLDVTSGGNSSTFGPFFISAGVITGSLFEGQNTLVVTVQDCFGTAQVTRIVFYRPDVTSTIIHVRDEKDLDVAQAEVFVNGRLRGLTDEGGRLVVTPTLPDGTKLAARKQVFESSTSRGNHSQGSSRNWKYRVYITSLPVNNDGTVPQKAVVLEPDPLAPQEVQVFRKNTLIGLHVVASLEWDASQPELDDVQTKFNDASQFLYNATDGQILYERIELVDDGAFWKDADYRIYADLSLRAHIDWPPGGFFEGGSPILIPRAPCVGCSSWNSKFQGYIHEFGHYGFGLLDEYKDGSKKSQCTALLCVPPSVPGCLPGPWPFGQGMPKASCLMFSETKASKFCSTRPENPHVADTDQGDSSCWHDIVEGFRDHITIGGSAARWILQSPETRGAIPGQINGGRIPIQDWVPRITMNNRSRLNLCAPKTFIVTKKNGTPVAGQDIWVLTTYGAAIYEGETDDTTFKYAAGNGKIFVTGLHVGDKVGFSNPRFVGLSPYSFGEYTVTRADCAPPPISAPAVGLSGPAGARQLTAGPAAFNLFVTVEPTAMAGQVFVRVSAEALTGNQTVKLAAAPSVKFTLRGHHEPQIVPLQLDSRTQSYIGFVNGLPEDAQGSIEVSAADLSNQTVSRLDQFAMTGFNPAKDTTVFSANGALSLSVPAGALLVGARVAIGPAPVKLPPLPPGFELVTGPYNIAVSTGERMSLRGTLLFDLPHSINFSGASSFDAFRILRYNASTTQWDNLGPGTFLPAPIGKVTFDTQQLGVFALVAHVAPSQAGGGPDVSRAVPTVAQLWPPNHRFVSVGIAGVISPAGPVSVVITRVNSDEATQSNKPGDNCADAIIDGATVRLRAERSGQGNGRVYTLYFTATDVSGHSNSGQVNVCVPHDQAGSDCIDDGLNIDATVCP
jgi:hypothetical protein